VLPENVHSQEVSDSVYSNNDSLYSESDDVFDEEEAAITEKKFDKKEWKKITKGVNFDEEKKTPPASSDKRKDFSIPSFDTGLAKIIFFSLVIVVLVFFLLKLFSGNGISNNKIKNTTDFNIEKLEENIQDTDFNVLLEKALMQKEYRLAIRIYYLIIIKELSAQQLINWKKDKTNNEYIRELSKTPFYKEFRLTTIAFERVWYGESQLLEEDYNRLSPMFKKMHDQIKPEATV
jgi:hypothetical protein